MIRKLISCGVGFIKFNILKLFYPKQIFSTKTPIIHHDVSIQIDRKSTLTLHSNVSIRRNTEINLRNNSNISIGENVFINSGCIITSHYKVVIGKNVELGPRVMIFDHDHKYKDGYENRGFNTSEIVIGDNVWIGAGSIILRGSHIGNNCVIAAGSVVKGNFHDNSLIYQEKNTHVKAIGR